MKPKLCWKRGAILLQTLVMSVLLSLIAVMVLKWVLARYIIANRIQASSENITIAQGYAALNVNTWGTPAYDSTTIDGKLVTFAPGGGGLFVTTVNDSN